MMDADQIVYDTVSLKIQPGAFSMGSFDLTLQASLLATDLDSVLAVVQDLKLSWVGKTQQEADDYNNWWLAVMTELFGSEDHPEYGVLNAMAGMVDAAGQSFSTTEYQVESLFDDFSRGLGDPPPPPGGGDATLNDYVDRVNHDDDPDNDVDAAGYPLTLTPLPGENDPPSPVQETFDEQTPAPTVAPPSADDPISP